MSCWIWPEPNDLQPSTFPLHSFTPSCFLPFPLPFLLPLQDAASRCRLAKQNHCALQYRRPIADLEGIGKVKLTSHCSLLTAPRVAIEPRGVIFNCSLLPASCFPLHVPHSSPFTVPRSPLPASCSLLPASRFTLLLLPVITCYRRESNPKLSIKSVCYAIGPCICPVFTGITVSQ